MPEAIGERPLRVVLACDFLVKYTAALARGIADAGGAPLLLTRTHDLEFGGRPGAMRAYVRARLGERTPHIELPGRPRDPRAIAGVARVRRAVRDFRPDVVHLQDTALNDPRLHIVAGARARRFAVTLHDIEQHLGDDDLPAWQRVAHRHLVVGHAGLVFVHAEALRGDCIRKFAPAAPVIVVPHGVDDARFEPLPDRPSLLFFGRIKLYKGLDTLLDAMPSVWRSLPTATLTIAGSGELPSHPSLTDARVRVINRHIAEDEVPGLFRRASCVVLPYREASQSGVGSTARRHGRAIVSTTVGGLPELVDADTGVLVPPENPVELAGAVVAVAGDPERARAMGMTSAARVSGESSWKRVGELTLAAYRRHLLDADASRGLAGPPRIAASNRSEYASAMDSTP